MMETCCCCMSLTTGAKILGSLGLFATAIILFAGFFFFQNIDQALSQFKTQYEDKMDDDIFRSIVFAILVAGMIILILNAIACSLLIMGAIQRRHSYIMPWLILVAIGLVIHVLYNTGRIYLEGNAKQIIISAVLSFVFQLYCFYAMCSLYSQLKRESIAAHNSGRVNDMKH